MSDTTTTASADRFSGHVGKGWLCLLIGWAIILFVPVPIIPMIVWGPLLLASLFLAVIGMQRGEKGLVLLLTLLIGSPIVFIAGVAFAAWVHS